MGSQATLRVRTRTWGMMLLGIMAMLTSVSAQQIHRQSFEGKSTFLRLGQSDGRIQLLEHQLSTTFAHDGSQAERMIVRVSAGTRTLIEYPTPKCRLFEEVSAKAWLLSNRTDVTMGLRVVLPKEKKDGTDEPLVVILEGSKLDLTERWRRLEVRRPDRLLEQKIILIQAERRKPVDAREAFIDAIVFDIGGKIGDSDLYLDDIEIGPVVESDPRTTVASDQAQAPMRTEEGQPVPNQTPEIRKRSDLSSPTVSGERLMIGDRPYLMLGMRWTDCMMERLPEWGINTIFNDHPLDEKYYQQAEKLKLKIVPMVSMTSNNRPATPEELNQVLPGSEDPALGVFVGGDLSLADEAGMAAPLAYIRRRTNSKPILADVKQGFRRFSRQFDMVGTYRYPLMSSVSLPAYQFWLRQMKNHLQPGTYFWTWIQTHPAEEYTQMVYGQGLDGSFDVPVGPQPGQIRLLAYNALLAGCRGLVYSSDRAFSTELQGRTRSLELALLNHELRMLDGFFAKGSAGIELSTSNPNVGAMAIRYDQAVLVVLYWRGPKDQYVLGEASLDRVKLIVPSAPESAQAFQVSVGEVKSVAERGRVPGGIGLTVEEFDTVGLVVLTSDISLFAKYQSMSYENAKLAHAWTAEMADLELNKVQQVVSRLESLGITLENVRGLMEKATQLRAQSQVSAERQDFRGAYQHAHRCLRVLRGIQYRCWTQVTTELTTPVSDPFAVSFYTLPESVEFQRSIKSASFGNNRCPSGDFEADGNLDAVGWSFESDLPDQYVAEPLLDHKKPKEGKRYLDLRVKASQSNSAPFDAGRATLFSPTVKVQAGQTVKVSGFIRVPASLSASIDGAMISDNLGGDALALRFQKPSDWQPFTFYRPINRAGDYRVTISLNTPGSVHIDQLKIELSESSPAPIAGKSRFATTIR